MYERTVRQAICKLCGYIKQLRENEKLPEICPYCQNGKAKFYTIKNECDSNKQSEVSEKG